MILIQLSLKTYIFDSSPRNILQQSTSLKPSKMRSSSAIAPLAFALRAAAVANDVWAFGNGFYSGPASGAHITKATWSIVPPTVPQGVTVESTDDEVWVSLWIGLSATAGSDDDDLYQPLLNWSPDQESQYV